MTPARDGRARRVSPVRALDVASRAPWGHYVCDPPSSPIYLSGVVGPATHAYADRDDLGVMVQPRTAQYLRVVHDYAGGFAVDNDCFARGHAFEADRWLAWVETIPRRGCHFVVAPDVVGDAGATWERSAPVLPILRSMGHVAALAAQDGIEHSTIDWDAFDCLFIGGSTAWKLSPAACEIAAEARERGLWTHLGRVNSRRRLRYATAMGYDSVDGTYVRFAPGANTARLVAWLEEFATQARPSLRGSAVPPAVPSQSWSDWPPASLHPSAALTPLDEHPADVPTSAAEGVR